MLIDILAEGCTQSWVTWFGSSCFERGVWTRQSPKVLSQKNCSVILWYYEKDEHPSREAWWKHSSRLCCGMLTMWKILQNVKEGRDLQATLIPLLEMDSTGIDPTILAPLALCSSQLSYSQDYPSLVSFSLPAADAPGITVFTSGFQRLTKSLSLQQEGHSLLFMPQQCQRPAGWRGKQTMLRMRILPKVRSNPPTMQRATSVPKQCNPHNFLYC